MSRVFDTIESYSASASLSRYGVEIIVVGDPSGAKLNRSVQKLLLEAQKDIGIWDRLLQASKALRWRRLTQVQPIGMNPAVSLAADEVARQANGLRRAIAQESVLDELVDAAVLVAETPSPLGDVLLRSISEVGASECLVVAANKAAWAGLADWLSALDVRVSTFGDIRAAPGNVTQEYVVGPPRFFPASVITAPRTDQITFLVPDWFADRALQQSQVSRYSEGSLPVTVRVHSEGLSDSPFDSDEDQPIPVVEDDFLPQPVWNKRPDGEREPAASEVKARKVLLSGHLATWLDDGERIRALDPLQPQGERVVYTEVGDVRKGTYLLLRRGESERGALYDSALELLGVSASSVVATQRSWKGALAMRLRREGIATVRSLLRANGVSAADQCRAWIEPTLIRPARDQDFERLLKWLDIPIQPTFANATRLRGAIYRASAKIREQLENAVDESDLSILDRHGYLSLELAAEGVRGIVATRVLDISTQLEIVARSDARVLFDDRSGQWLE